MCEHLQQVDCHHVTCHHRVHQEEQEILVIVVTNAIRRPRTVMIHAQYVSTHGRAEMRTIWLEATLLLAIPQLSVGFLTLVYDEPFASFPALRLGDAAWIGNDALVI